jgi:DNA-binding transcriptional MerR regulator
VTLTVSDIAQRIVKPGMDKARLVERLRHWTREGLLSPIGERRPGTGRHRRYSESAVFDAAVLSALADRGIQVGVLHTVLKLARHHLESNATHGYLEIAYIDRKPVALLHDLPRVHPSTEFSFVLNLNQLFKGLKSGG